MTTFCGEDPRLGAVVSIPLQDAALAIKELDIALREGASAVWVPHRDCGGRSPGHTEFDAFWARLADAGVPFVLHVGGYPLQVPEAWSNNGRPSVRDWMGGGENVRSVDMTVMHHAPERFLGAMVFDGVFERFPRLKGAAIELGANWAPAMLQRLDDLVAVFSKSEPALREFARKPSQQLTEQFAFTPFVFEDVGKLIAQSSPELYLFSSDYPHAEGGRNPIGRFERALEGCDDGVQAQFWSGNFERIFGTV